LSEIHALRIDLYLHPQGLYTDLPTALGLSEIDTFRLPSLESLRQTLRRVRHATPTTGRALCELGHTVSSSICLP